MSILPIITYPNPILEKKAKQINDPNDPVIAELILDMLETMENSNGVGLAAPQIGQSLQLSTIKLENTTYVLINPKIIWRSWKKNVSEEGCLSFPGRFIPVKRYSAIKIEALDRKGKKIQIESNDFLARVLQHEIDHLNGVLYIKREAKIPSSKKNDIDNKKIIRV